MIKAKIKNPFGTGYKYFETVEKMYAFFDRYKMCVLVSWEEV